jgi:hypothetical protein
MAAAAKNPDLVYKVTFLHASLFFATFCKDAVSTGKRPIKETIMNNRTKMRQVLATSIALLLISSCSKPVCPEIPACIEAKIDALKAQPKQNPAGEVRLYDYKGKTVYGFSAGCCDQFYSVYDAYCNYVCAPSGGITGKGDGSCPDFDSTAKDLGIIWKDPR